MRLLSLALLAVVSGCSSSITEVVVFVDAPGLQVPRDLDALTFLVTDRNLPDGSPDELSQSVAPLCPSGTTGDSCFSFPLSLTLVPGPSRPGDLVRVELLALLNAKVVTDDAVDFNFSPGGRRRLDLVLSPACLGVLCADGGACDPSGACAQLSTAPLDEIPDLQSGQD